jgi:hypothetical protein
MRKSIARLHAALLSLLAGADVNLMRIATTVHPRFMRPRFGYNFIYYRQTSPQIRM